MPKNPGESQPIPEPVLVCFAVKEEARHFVAARARHDDQVKALTTGMGQFNADLMVGMALAARRPALVITAGFAGGLNPKLGIGQVVFEADPETGLAERLVRSGAIAGTFYCAERVAVCAAEKSSLWKSSGADAVEMESGIIRKICRTAGIPSATVRVISDAANEDLPLDFNTVMTADYRISYARLAWKIATHPWKIPALMQFQKRTATAARRLATVLNEVLAARE
jgi:adenosylhomocysteine nucleosidase